MANSSRNTVVGAFQDQWQAQGAMDALMREGFTDEQIGFIVRSTEEHIVKHEDAPPARTEGAAGGLLAGAGVGALIGAAGSLLIPGIGPVLAGGILASSLGGAAVGAAAGTVLGGLVGAGVPEEEAKEWESDFIAGRLLVIVYTDRRADRAAAILREHNGYVRPDRKAA